MYRHSARKPKGYAIWSFPDKAPIERETLQCCHCGRHWIVVPGSGRKRGFCTKCMQVTCGHAKCDPCVPVEKQLDMIEKGKIDGIKISVPGSF